MTEGPLQDLTQLRDMFVTLRDALAVNDVAGVEAATEKLRAAFDTLATGAPLSPEAQNMLRDVAALSGDVAAVLASRMRAFDHVIEALRTDEGAAP